MGWQQSCSSNSLHVSLFLSDLAFTQAELQTPDSHPENILLPQIAPTRQWTNYGFLIKRMTKFCYGRGTTRPCWNAPFPIFQNENLSITQLLFVFDARTKFIKIFVWQANQSNSVDTYAIARLLCKQDSDERCCPLETEKVFRRQCNIIHNDMAKTSNELLFKEMCTITAPMFLLRLKSPSQFL